MQKIRPTDFIFMLPYIHKLVSSPTPDQIDKKQSQSSLYFLWTIGYWVNQIEMNHFICSVLLEHLVNVNDLGRSCLQKDSRLDLTQPALSSSNPLSILSNDYL